MFSKRDSPSKQRDKPCSQCGCGCVSSVGGKPRGNSLWHATDGVRSPVNGKGNLLINVNGTLQSWITDSNITVYAPSQKTLDAQ